MGKYRISGGWHETFSPDNRVYRNILLAGCFQVSTVVRVNPDGSGTVSETMLLSKKMIARMDELMQGFAGENGAKQESVDLFDPVKLKAQAADMEVSNDRHSQ